MVSSSWRRRDKENGHISKPVSGQRGVALAFLISPSLLLSSFPSFLCSLPGCFFSLFPPRHCFAVAFLGYITLCGSSLLFPNSFLILCVDPSLDSLLAASSLPQLRLSCSSSLSSLLTLPHSLSVLSYPHPAFLHPHPSVTWT